MSLPIVQDDQIAKLTPSLFSARDWSTAIDEDVREQFVRVYKPLRDQGLPEYHLWRLATALYFYRPLLSDLLRPTQTKTVLEIGSGWGMKALGLANLFQSYIGIDLNAEDAARCDGFLREVGISNVRIICEKADTVLENPAKYGIEHIDLLILFAVLEHLTIPERQAILRLAQDVYCQGGHVLIAEAPNRLCRFDQHSWQLSFADSLPPELASAYSMKSEREHLKKMLKPGAEDQGFESLYRIGRGISFHEFECFWDKIPFDNLGILTDGYTPELLTYYPLMNDEVDLLRYCHDNQLNIPRLFTRYWIEGLFSRNGNGQGKNAHYVMPQELEVTTPSIRRRFWERSVKAPPPAINRDRRYWNLDDIPITTGCSFLIRAPEAATGAQQTLLLIDLGLSSGRIVVEEIQSGTRSVLDLAKLMEARLPMWHTHAALPLGPSTGVYRLQPEGDGAKVTCRGVLFV